ncbi:hypothetical protein [Streptomyces sp. NPDC004134]|uniref:YobI family P-loop NTPase n=1 Tax=Streptomyces sp. NPDC004134 TaxID=3364691 RepID=UPI0036C127FF
MPLESLTPKYEEGHHGTYLRRLEEAVKDPKNLNIALTGRYGAGKSSVLNEFQANHDKSVLRLAISTLAPGEEGESTTNRIQKEIVKQLLYGASEKVGKNSRFHKIAVLGKRKAFAQSAAVVGTVGGLLYLLGLLPHIKWTGAHEATWVRVAAWAGAAVLATLLVSAVRMLTYGRLTVSDVSAGGAALTLTEKPQSFFDMYLDEIVHYFSRESKDIVVFEDLDRFEDPHIFEALRELNILLNETPERRAKRHGNRPGHALRWLLGHMKEDWPDRLATKLSYRWAARLLGLGTPLRFVYAVRDSVFGKIDADTASRAVSTTAAGIGAAEPVEATPTMVAATDGGMDAAAAETLRANRTKFFDVVIPLVPFISHRNARDLLQNLLKHRGITGIESRLVNTVAQHCTDMRLMRNICNEYLVFAERLLEPVEPNKTAPGMDASHLFALVVYKNFHLEDFENITRRDSDLDRLYDLHQRLVRESIAAKDQRKRFLLAEPSRVRTRSSDAERLGKRLRRYAEAEIKGTGWSYLRFVVGSDRFIVDDVTDYAFWAAVAQAQRLTIAVSPGQAHSQTQNVATFDRAGLEMFAPEGLDAHRWAEFDATAVDAELDDIERDIEELRCADFAQLVKMPRFELTPTPTADGAGPQDQQSPQTFAQLLVATLKSQLACELVRRGYIDRNFPLYAAQFYGTFTGVDVANFMVQHVQNNIMAIDYDLSRAGAVANLLAEAEEAGEELVHTVAAYNIDIVNHLLATDHPGAGDVANQLVAGWPSEGASTFLAAYFTSEAAERDKLAARLTEHRWRDVFTYLVGNEGVPEDARTSLVSAALCAFDPDATYDLDQGVRAFVLKNYREMPAFTGPQPADERDPERLDEILRRASIVVPELKPLKEDIRKRVVDANRYELTADNLRSALDITGDVSLEKVHGNPTVYAYCLDDLPAYLAAVDQDPKTDHALISPQTLITVLNDIVEDGDNQQVDPHSGDLADVLARTSSDARLRRLRDAPKSTWTALAAADLFHASLANLESYRAEVGSIDTHLASLLEQAGTINVDESEDTADPDGADYDSQAAAVAILNASTMATSVRVDLVTSLGAATPLPVDGLVAEGNDLFALLLERGIVDDDETSFAHFRAGGWPALGRAIKGSKNIGNFVSPDLVSGMVGEVLTDSMTAAKLGAEILADVEDYVPDDNWAALNAVAVYADAQQLPLLPQTVIRIARVGQEHREVNTPLVLRLLCSAASEASADDIVNAFAHLGGPYSKITRPGATFKVDRDGTHDQLLKVLKAAGRITRGTTRLSPPRYTVTVL